jgi:hypothetical protein
MYDKIFPSSFLLDIEGSAISALLPGDFGIETISIGSKDFNTDMAALSALQQSMRNILQEAHLDIQESNEELAFNPDFYPQTSIGEVSELRRQEEKELAEAEEIEIQDGKDGSRHIKIPITKIFDPMGDYITTRWTINNPSFLIESRVMANIESYILHKKRVAAVELDPSAPPSNKKIYFH